MHAYYDKYGYECDKFIDNNLMVYMCLFYALKNQS